MIGDVCLAVRHEITGNRKTGGWDRTDGFSMCPKNLCRRFQPSTGWLRTPRPAE